MKIDETRGAVTSSGGAKAASRPVPKAPPGAPRPEPVRPRIDDHDREIVLDLRRPEPADRRDTRFLRPGEGLLGAGRFRRAVKRGIDLAGAGALITLLSPLMLGLALLVRFTSEGPVLFRQRRVGRNGEPFEMLKFRTMYQDAEQRRAELEGLNEQDGPVFKIRSDPRVTPVGAHLRRWSLDELPQLFNVLTGEMSLVGPRPPLPEEVSTYGRWEAQRLLVKPGLTCIWQVNGRSEVDFETWMEMDIDYIAGWSLRKDLTLLAKTVPAVVRRDGAY